MADLLNDFILSDKKLSKAQVKWLQTCKDHVTLIIGGIDATPGLRRNMVNRLHAMGLIEFVTPKSVHEESEWKLTEFGKRMLEAATR